ncbi:MAG TPA: hypothetical protein VFF56_01375 [Bacillota bacterium]|nr:hypothetical protein [Bacillota bacterium]
MAYSVDTTIQYRGYNTFKMIAPARVKSWMYGVEGLDSISHGLYVYCPTNQASAVRAKTRWLNSDGITQSVVDHSFAIEAGLFNWIKIQAIPVPIGAVQALTEIINFSGATFWVGLIKTEAGNTTTDFTENKAGQLTKITASGIYTGTIQAAQVVVANDRLPERLTTINSSIISISDGLAGLRTDVQAGRITLSDDTKGKIAGMTVDTTSLTFSGTGSYFRITSDGVSDFIRAGASSSSLSFRVDKNGKLYATGAVIDGDVTARIVTNSNKAGYAVVGYGPQGGSGIEYVNGSDSTKRFMWSFTTDFGVAFYLHHKPRIGIYPSGDIMLFDDVGPRLQIFSNDGTYLNDSTGVSRLFVSATNGDTLLQNKVNSHAIGVDNTGPYYIKSRIKTYF